MPFMEDFELVRRLRRRSAPAHLPASVTTSARRWDAMGLFRVAATNQIIVLGYLCGGTVERLAAWYRAGRDMGGAPAPRNDRGGRTGRAMGDESRRRRYEASDNET